MFSAGDGSHGMVDLDLCDEQRGCCMTKGMEFWEHGTMLKGGVSIC